MKHFFEKLGRITRNYGGMLFIAILGLSFLVFGGILTNARQTHDLRTSIENFERAREEQIQLKPLIALLDSRQQVAKSTALPAPTAALPIAEIPEISKTFDSFAETAGIELNSVRHLLQPASEEMMLRVEVRLSGEMPAFRAFLNQLFSWKYRTRLEGFSIEAVPEEQQIQLVIGIALQ